MDKLVVRGKMMIDGEIRENQILVCQAGKFTYVGPIRDEEPDIVLEKGYVLPGYIDIHVHGSNGYDLMGATEEAIEGVASSLAQYGVTGFLATTLTADWDSLMRVLESFRQFTQKQVSGAELLGVHLEGPWINEQYKGAQNAAHFMDPTLEAAQELWNIAGEMIKIVTLAPEKDNAKEVVRFLQSHEIKVAVGHSNATYEQVKEVLPLGVSHVTHCFNAMSGLHHREPGIAGAALYHQEVTAELIADGIHVHPVMMNILYRLKAAEKLVLVSDGTKMVGLVDGVYDLGALQIYLVQGVARLPDGTLAGSTLTLDQAVQNMVRLCHVPVADAVTMASQTPARIAGADQRKGKLKEGYDADFIFTDEELNVERTFIDGRLIYSRE